MTGDVSTEGLRGYRMEKNTEAEVNIARQGTQTRFSNDTRRTAFHSHKIPTQRDTQNTSVMPSFLFL